MIATDSSSGFRLIREPVTTTSSSSSASCACTTSAGIRAKLKTRAEETPASVAKREMHSEQRKLARAAAAAPDHKPSKKERRDIQRFKRDNLE